MAVQHIARRILIHQPEKGVKALVRQIFCVSQTTGRGMGHQNVHPAGTANLPGQVAGPLFHLLLRILMRAGSVTHRAAQSGNAQSLDIYHGVLNALAAFRRYILITGIVVAMHVQHRHRRKGGQKREVSGIQIPAGDHQIIALQFAGLIVLHR